MPPGFRGLTRSSALLVGNNAFCFREADYCGSAGSNPANSAVVCFELAADDELGAHAPVVTADGFASRRTRCTV